LAIHPQTKEFASSIHKRGIQLTNRMMGREAGRLLPSFKEKTVRVKAIAMHQFMYLIGHTQHVATYTAQKHFTVTEDYVMDFIAMMRMKLQGQDPLTTS
jgi:hypothetical protein